VPFIKDNSALTTPTKPPTPCKPWLWELPKPATSWALAGTVQTHWYCKAKNQLYKNFPLRENEVYGTFSVDIKRSYFLLYAQTQVVVSADILAPNNGQTSVPSDTGLAATRALLYVEGTKRKAIPVQVLKDQGNGTCQTISFSDGEVEIKNRYKRDLLYPFAHPVNVQKQHMLKQLVNFQSAYYREGSAAKGKILAAGSATFLVEVLDTKEQFILYPWEFYTD
jgi:hypothetical protein